MLYLQDQILASAKPSKACSTFHCSFHCFHHHLTALDTLPILLPSLLLFNKPFKKTVLCLIVPASESNPESCQNHLSNLAVQHNCRQHLPNKASYLANMNPPFKLWPKIHCCSAFLSYCNKFHNYSTVGRLIFILFLSQCEHANHVLLTFPLMRGSRV